MAGVDPYGLGSVFALLLGAMLLVAGLHGRKRGYARRLEGFAILSSGVAFVGLAAITLGAYGVLKG